MIKQKKAIVARMPAFKIQFLGSGTKDNRLPFCRIYLFFPLFLPFAINYEWYSGARYEQNRFDQHDLACIGAFFLPDRRRG